MQARRLLDAWNGQHDLAGAPRHRLVDQVGEIDYVLFNGRGNDDLGRNGNGDRDLRAIAMRLIAVQLFPRMRGVAPASAELEIDPMRDLAGDDFAAEPRHHLALLARRDRAIQTVVHLQKRRDAFAPDRPHP